MACPRHHQHIDKIDAPRPAIAKGVQQKPAHQRVWKPSASALLHGAPAVAVEEGAAQGVEQQLHAAPRQLALLQRRPPVRRMLIKEL